MTGGPPAGAGAEARCPRCGAVLRGGSWCWLCQADLSTTAEPDIVRAPLPAADRPPVASWPPTAPSTAPSAAPPPPPPEPDRRVDLPPPAAGAGAGHSGLQTTGPAGGDAGIGPDVDVEAMLAALRAQEAGGIERVADRVPDRGRRLALAAVAVVLVVLVLVLVATVLGGLFR